jgi:hypothetical protein
VIFSAFHLQLFGLVPRILLGAYLGYLLYWSKSLWVPMIAHIFNNTLVVISEYYSANTGTESAIENLGGSLNSVGDYVVVLVSLAMTIVGIILLRNTAKIQIR